MGQELELLRSKLADLDQQILEILSQRMSISAEIGRLKLTRNLAINQPEWWKETCGRRTILAKQLNLKPDFVNELYEIIHLESKSKQTHE